MFLSHSFHSPISSSSNHTSSILLRSTFHHVPFLIVSFNILCSLFVCFHLFVLLVQTPTWLPNGKTNFRFVCAMWIVQRNNNRNKWNKLKTNNMNTTKTTTNKIMLLISMTFIENDLVFDHNWHRNRLAASMAFAWCLCSGQYWCTHICNYLRYPKIKWVMWMKVKTRPKWDRL